MITQDRKEDKAIKKISEKAATIGGENNNIPDNVLREVAKCFLVNIIAFFDTEEGKKEFEEWKQNKKLINNADKKSEG